MSLFEGKQIESEGSLRNLLWAELLFVLSVETQLVGELAKSRFNSWIDILYMLMGISLPLLFLRAWSRHFVEALRSFGRNASAILLVDVFVSLMRLK